MSLLLHIVIFLSIIFVVARFSLSTKAWTIFLAVAAFLHLFTGASGWLSLLLIVLVAVMGALVFLPGVRKALMTAPMFNLLKSHLPAMSDTEREAIESGTVGWEAQLFRGNPDWSILFDYPNPTLSTEEQQFLDNETNSLCALMDDWQVNKFDKDLSKEAWDYIKNNKFFGLIIPKKYGGKEFSEQAHAAIVTRLSTRCVASAVTVMVPNSLGPGKLIKQYGTQEQKDYYLPRLANGQEIPCFALTAPTAGSDAAAIPDTGVIVKGEVDGKEVLGLKLNWDKRYITLAPVATILGLAFHVLDPDKLLGDKENLGLTCALIKTDMQGVTIGRRHNPLDSPFQNGPTQGKDVFIPLEMIIGGVEQIGKGWKMLMESLAVGRGISLPAQGNAAGQYSVVTASAYARVRKQFNLSIGYFEGVAEKLAFIGGYAYAMDACSKLITSTLMLGEKPAVLSAMIKYFNTEGARMVTDANMDIHAGKAIIKGPSNYLADAHKAMPVSITVEGANILTRTLMIFGQGAIRCHPYLQKEMTSLQADDLDEFDSAIIGHMGYLITNKARAFLHSFTGGWLSSYDVKLNHGKQYIRKMNALSASLALISDVAFSLLGGKLKRKEMLTGQFADAWTGLCVCSAVLKKYQDEGSQKEDQALVDWICQTMLHQSYTALSNVTNNLPLTWLVKPIHLFYLPKMGIPKPPSHKLSNKVSQLLLADSDSKRRLSAWCYIPENKDDAVKVLLEAYATMPMVDEIEQRIRRAGLTKSLLQDEEQWLESLSEAGILNAQEKEDYVAARALIHKAISVDDFAPDEI